MAPMHQPDYPRTTPNFTLTLQARPDQTLSPPFPSAPGLAFERPVPSLQPPAVSFSPFSVRNGPAPASRTEHIRRGCQCCPESNREDHAADSGPLDAAIRVRIARNQLLPPFSPTISPLNMCKGPSDAPAVPIGLTAVCKKPNKIQAYGFGKITHHNVLTDGDGCLRNAVVQADSEVPQQKQAPVIDIADNILRHDLQHRLSAVKRWEEDDMTGNWHAEAVQHPGSLSYCVVCKAELTL
ncbi:hypothetical protein EVG20_g47 [Dentipellis fragilis]|uniref:Uncharacterized protein n=1 Tax=Dentipellis fragilis TaxID=205917 RepID=A0A4Y9ZEH9_9AGAM|nr:hypothetical protein EVG20_g47 [Dentipellis fragilis]